MTLLIAEKTVVTMHYTLTDQEGTTLDSSRESDPLSYLHGVGALIPGLEKELTGKAAGATLTVSVPPEEAYGEVIDELLQEVDKSIFEVQEGIEPGAVFHAQGPDGEVQPVVIKAVQGETVIVDANHPLAGMTLNFDVEVISVREATDDELDHGHAHGADGSADH